MNSAFRTEHMPCEQRFSANALRVTRVLTQVAMCLMIALGVLGFAAELSHGVILGYRWPWYGISTSEGYQATLEAYVFLVWLAVWALIETRPSRPAAPAGTVLVANEEGILLERGTDLVYRGPWPDLQSCSIHSGSVELVFADRTRIPLDAFPIPVEALQRVAALSGPSSPLSNYWTDYQRAAKKVQRRRWLSATISLPPLAAAWFVPMMQVSNPALPHAARIPWLLLWMADLLALGALDWFVKRPLTKLSRSYHRSEWTQAVD